MTANITREQFRSSEPDTTSTFSLPGLNGEATVYRDRQGIPHGRAGSTWDAFFIQGFYTAQDRLFQMDYDRRRAYGRCAEFVGPDALPQDRLMRRFRLKASAEADLRVVSDDAQQMLEAYAAGVNAFIETTNALPVEYEILGASPGPWLPHDSLGVFKVRHILMGVFEQKLWRAKLLRQVGPEMMAALCPGYQQGQLVIVPPGAEYEGAVDGVADLLQEAESWMQPMEAIEVGSNNWVLAGSRTASGGPILAGDPHRGLDTPNVYYQNHVACPDFDVIGLSFPGVPGFPHFGHNDRVAWCVTHTGADYQDLYLEHLRAGEAPAYEYKGEWLPLEVHRETIKVRGHGPVQVEVPVTHHGPVIGGSVETGVGLAFRYSATCEAQPWADALLSMLEVDSADAMDEAMRCWVDPANNFLYADVDGNIAYLTRGRIPVRHEANRWTPVPGWDGEHEWQGDIPFEELPRSTNPDGAYIVTANNRVAGEGYPHYIALDFAPGFRANRLTHRLLQLDKATVNDMMAMHSEKTSIPAAFYGPKLASLEIDHPLAGAARKALAHWDGEMSPDLAAPTIYSATRDRLVRKVLEPILGPLAAEAFSPAGRGGPGHVARLRSQFPQMIEAGDRTLLPTGADWQSLLSEAFTDALDDLSQRLGPDATSWSWGAVHHTRPRHPLSAASPDLAGVLDPPSVSMGGDGDTPQAGSYSPGDQFAMTSMSVARYAFDLADWDGSTWVVPLGSSGHPGSAHYADQATMWQQVRMLPMTYSWEKLKAEAESCQTALPG